MSEKTDAARAILSWVQHDPANRADEGLTKLAALNVPDDSPDAPQVRGVGQSLTMMAEAAEFLKSS